MEYLVIITCMLELNLSRKNKINLSDYNSQQEIANRIFISDFSLLDFKVMEEILFSPLKISFKKMSRSLEMEEKELAQTLRKFRQAGLLTVQDDAICIDKEMRKWFELQMQRFDPDFRPDLEFIQGLLRRVPIHLLPIWYATPRSSNNLFESILEKHLLTPQIFQRHLDDLRYSHALLHNIIKDLFANPNLSLSSSDLIAKYNLTRAGFEEIMLLLEFNFVCTIRYTREEEHWHEIITPFYEWHQYLCFLESIKATAVDPAHVQCKRVLEKRAIPQHALNLRDIEKAIFPFLSGEWILVEPFICGAIVPPNIDSIATLKKLGAQWKYTLPTCSENQKETIRTAIFGTLYECGMATLGTYKGQDCFAITAHGKAFFERMGS